MEKIKSTQEKEKRSAEEWVLVARSFGETCVEIQKDPKLTVDQKFEKQKVLSENIVKKIKHDFHLEEEAKNQMIESINNYMNQWQSIDNVIQKDPAE